MDAIYEIVLAIHIASAVGAFGLVLAAPLLAATARRAGPETLRAFHRLQADVGQRLVSWGSALVLAAGLYLTVDGPYDLGDPWIGSSFAILIVLAGLAGAWFAPRERRLAQDGGDDATLQAVRWVAAALVVVAVFLMVTKPGA